jgi:mannose-6-phosphate isomerase-like protein (cupin superfamily)
MTKFEHYHSGQVFGIKYTFETTDDGLPWHAHTDVDAHNVCVMSGHVKIVFVAETVYLKPGDTYDFDGARRHAIQAVTPGACVLNLFLNGQPETYRALPESELKGEFDVRKFNR